MTKNKATKMTKQLLSVTTLALCSMMLSACGGFGKAVSFGTGQTGALSSSSTSGVAGVGTSTVPTSDAAVGRITNGLERQVNPAAGNFKTFVTQVKNNLPKTSDPTKAAGYDQIHLLAFGACSDLTTGGAKSLMMTKYAVNPAGTIASNQAALVAAGVHMMDQYTGGLASNSAVSAQVNSIFSGLVSQSAATSSNTSTIAFMTVCMTANAAGTTMLGM